MPKVSLPPKGGMVCMMVFRRVDFPVPLPPIMPKRSPLFRVKFRVASGVVWPIERSVAFRTNVELSIWGWAEVLKARMSALSGF